MEEFSRLVPPGAITVCILKLTYLANWPWPANKNLRSIKVSRKLPTYPSPKPTLTPTSHVGQNIYSG